MGQEKRGRGRTGVAPGRSMYTGPVRRGPGFFAGFDQQDLSPTRYLPPETGTCSATGLRDERVGAGVATTKPGPTRHHLRGPYAAVRD